MVTVVDESLSVRVPSWVKDLASFRRWTELPEFPKEGRVWWLQGEVWIDRSREQIFTHVLVKTEFTIVLGQLAKSKKLGLFLADGLRLSHFETDLSGVPDATFISVETLDSDRVRLLEGAEGGYVEVQGSPDMVLEVVSRSSVKKDTELLRKLYWEAGIPEYWLVDARGPLRFDILKHGPRGYAAARKQDGWCKSGAFGAAFRLTQEQDMRGNPAYTLEMK